MLMKKIVVNVLFAAGIFGAFVTPLPSVAAVDLYVNIGPPPERYEPVPAPRAGYVWAPGYWDWRDNRHVWSRGVWVRERQGYAYEPHRWVEHDGRWRLDRGRWNQARGRDSDRDGIPDRRDRHPYNPNRP